MQVTSHRHDCGQLTVPHADIPAQVVEHRPVPHVIFPQAALPPEQFESQRPVVHEIFPHAPLPVHCALQCPEVQLISPHAALPPEHVALHVPVVQLIVPQAPLPVHVASQFPVEQPMLPHAFEPPLHFTVHGFDPHITSRHAVPALHVISHDFAEVHEMSPHAPTDPHVMVQFHPLGHVTLAPPFPPSVHVIEGRSHEVHAAGHANASMGTRASRYGGLNTQYPRSHLRPSWQSASVVHASCSERRSTVQRTVAAAAAITTRAAM